MIFEDWLKQYKGLFFKVIRAYARTAIDQDDLFQDISVQVWNSIPAFKNESSPSTWIYRIAINTAVTWHRRESRHVTADAPVLERSESPPDERLTWLYEAINGLDTIDRSIALMLLEGYSYKEMATIVGITESNIGVKINRIKKQLIAQSKKTDHGI